MAGYAYPEALVDTTWVADHGGESGVRLIEVDVDTSAYQQGHVPGALAWNWTTELSDPIRRDVLSKEALEHLMSQSGVDNDTTVVLYGDNNNWFAAWALWQLKLYGHNDVRLMNGGRRKWLEEGRELSTDLPEVAPASYVASGPDLSLRAFLAEAMEASEGGGVGFVDVRSPDEFTGRILAPPGLPETCQRGGHIPGAQNIPWGQTCNDDGTFKSFEELRDLYASKGIMGDQPTITYCRIGERSSHSWFVLKYLLGYNDVRNYDGSWTEWGNLIGMPVERG